MHPANETDKEKIHRLERENDDLRTLAQKEDAGIFLRGNLSDGFTAHGPYASASDALEAHDGDEGWMLTLTAPAGDPKEDRP